MTWKYFNIQNMLFKIRGELDKDIKVNAEVGQKRVELNSSNERLPMIIMALCVPSLYECRKGLKEFQ